MQEPSPPPRQRPAGRPASIDPEAVARLAVTLFADRGYEAVSMDDIAAAAGIGRKSLYRYFPSKAALVWGGLEEATVSSREVLIARHATTGESILDSLRDAAREAARSLPDLDLTRGRLRLISSRSELGAHSHAMLESQRIAVAEFLEDSGLSGPDAFYVSSAYSAALFAGWLHWAHGKDALPTPHLMQALAVLRIPAF